ncbi:MAG: STAS/SEC14 domain-containing protein [Chloroflexia bacterium]|nr:STAS/SEC14 domain-containing protein [Chloroflexia bacterium]
MAKVEIKEFRGKRIVCMSFSNLRTEEEISAIIEVAKPIIRNSPPNSVYTITDIGGMHFNNKIRDLFTDFTGGNKNFVKASAVIGASGLQNLMINGINKITGRKLKSFPDESVAKEWLVSQN